MITREFWPDAVQWWWLAAGFLIGATALAAAVRFCSPLPVPHASTTDPYHLKLIEWERDRVATAAKGVAGTSVGFLAAVVTALVKDEISGAVSGLCILGCLLGAAGVLLLGIHWSLAAGRFVRHPGTP